MDIRDICEASGIAPRPSYYSGRGPTTSDLNDAILTKMHGLIHGHHGERAAAAFVALVAALPIPSASAFLNAVFALEDNNWVFAPEQAQATNICPEDGISAFATVENVMTRASARRRNPSEAEHVIQRKSAAVRASFLYRHGDKDAVQAMKGLYGWY